MTQDRLSHLATISLEKDFGQNWKYDDIIDDFASRNGGRVKLYSIHDSLCVWWWWWWWWYLTTLPHCDMTTLLIHFGTHHHIQSVNIRRIDIHNRPIRYFKIFFFWSAFRNDVTFTSFCSRVIITFDLSSQELVIFVCSFYTTSVPSLFVIRRSGHYWQIHVRRYIQKS